MLTRINMTRTPTYKLGMERGMEKGEAHLLLRIPQAKFGSLPRQVEELIKQADRSQLELWGDRLASALTLDDVISQAHGEDKPQ